MTLTSVPTADHERPYPVLAKRVVRLFTLRSRNTAKDLVRTVDKQWVTTPPHWPSTIAISTGVR